MDLKKTLYLLVHLFDKYQVEYGLIGGMSLAALGIHRTTVDIDFLIKKEHMEKVHPELLENGYKRFHFTENVSQYVHEVLLPLDFIHAFRPVSLEMLERASWVEFLGFRLKVLSPEDIIGLKLQAIVNDPERKVVQLADIKLIIDSVPSLDRERVKNFFRYFGLEALIKEVMGEE